MARKCPPVPPSLSSRLEAAEQAQARYVEKTAKFNNKAEKCKMAVQAKSQKKAEKYAGKAEKYAIKAAEQQKEIANIKGEIEIALAQAMRIRCELIAQKPGIVAMFQSVLGDGPKFARNFQKDPEMAVYKAIFALAKDKRKIHLPVKQGPESIRDYKWSDNGAAIISAEAVMLLVPALAHGPHKDRTRAFDIVRNRIYQLNIHHTNCADNLWNPGWSKSCGENGWWVAHLSAFVRDVVPILPAVKKEIDECRGCNACRAARRRP